VHTAPHRQLKHHVFLVACVVLALGLAASPLANATWDVDWQRWDVFSHLQNDGSVYVTETMTVRLNGTVTSLERRLPKRTDQEIVIKRFVRMEEPEAVEIVAGSGSDSDRFTWRDGKLSWNVKPPDGNWDQKEVGFRLEYELRNAIAPIWDIPAGPSSFTRRGQFPQFIERLRGLLDSWRQAAQGWDRRYRYDHDVLFADFPGTGPVELNYTFKHDDAWVNPAPQAPLGRATPNVDYRVTEIRDYLRRGWPPAIELWRPAVRVGSILGSILIALLLWLIFVVGEIRRRGLIGRRVNRDWFTQHVLSRPPEIVASDAGTTDHVSLFRLFLHQMKTKGVLSLHAGEEFDADGDPVYRLRLLKDDHDLQPFERTIIQKLFPEGRREINSEEFFRIHEKEGFEPDKELGDAMNDLDELAPAASTKGPSCFWRCVRFLSPLLFMSSCAGVLVETVQQESTDFYSAAAFTGCFLIVVPMLSLVFRRPMSWAMSALIALVPILLAVPGIITFHLVTTLPLGPAGSLGVAIFALWCVAAMLQMVRTGEKLVQSPRAKIAEIAQGFVRRELRRSNPALDDSWMPHLVALGFSEAVDKWRRGRVSGSNPIAAPLVPGQLPSVENLRPFVGDLSSLPSKEWTDAFYVLSEEERKEWEEGDDEEEEQKP
jgi:hypothetical protein